MVGKFELLTGRGGGGGGEDEEEEGMVAAAEACKERVQIEAVE